MAANEHYFVEWKEQYVSKERGYREVHYFLKDNHGESILSVVGTERSVRHMLYVVADEFLSIYGVSHAGFRWRSKKEVVDWLTSLLPKQYRRGNIALSLKEDPTFEVNTPKLQMSSSKDHLTKTLKDHCLSISWSGPAWLCGKKLKHYRSFRRNGVSIGVQSFVFIMGEKENRYIAYLEDMYEDRKCQKKVKVRWLHQNKEVKGIASLENLHPKEVFITSYVQVISAECIDAPAIVLTRKHYEKCIEVFPSDLLSRVHFCSRQFKSDRVKHFKLSKLYGYFDQPIFTCFSPDFFEEKEFNSEDGVKVGMKRNIADQKTYDLPKNKLKFTHCPTFTLNEKVEFLCQDSGIRGCWFKCIVIEISKRQMKVLYDDVKDEDNGSNLEEWIPIHRLAKADILEIRHLGRPTIRPALSCEDRKHAYEVGDSVDAWWSNGWWEGVITYDYRNGSYRIYIPGENIHMDAEVKNLRVSRDWVDGRWVDIKQNPDILCLISDDTKCSATSTTTVLKNTNSDYSYSKIVTVVSSVEEDICDLADMQLTNVPLTDECNFDALARENQYYYENFESGNMEMLADCC